METSMSNSTFYTFCDTEYNYDLAQLFAKLVLTDKIYIDKDDGNDWHFYIFTTSIFTYSNVDTIEIESAEELIELYQYYCKDNEHGMTVWMCKKLKSMPLQTVYNEIQRNGIWDLDKMKLDKNAIEEYYLSL